MDFEDYNKSYDKIIESIDEDNRLRDIRRRCIRDFIERLNSSRKEWDTAFEDILKKSQEESSTESFLKNSESLENSKPENGLFSLSSKPLTFLAPVATPSTEKVSAPLTQPDQPKNKLDPKPKLSPLKPIAEEEHIDFKDPDFSNLVCLKEYIRIQDLLEQSRKLIAHIHTDTNLKSFKNDLNLFIRTQINSISNSDMQHLNTKIKFLTNLFSGQKITFQGRIIDASLDPQGQLFSMDLAAQTFVIVGTKLVNSVPAIAQSMATVINAIIDNNLLIFKDLIMGQLQERCPYLVPMHPKVDDFSGEKDGSLRYKIACGYHYDTRTNTLESEEKYLARMRSMVLVYACILIQAHIHQAWTWLAAFLSLEPEPVITALVLQAFLQEASKKLSSSYGRQYKKLLAFIKEDYIKMIEQVTPKTSDRQSFIKLKNLLSDDTQLIEAPSVSSIFGAVRFN